MPRYSCTLRRFFIVWLLSVAAFAVLLLSIYAVLDRGRDEPPLYAPPEAKHVPLAPSPKTPVPSADASAHLLAAFAMRGICQTDGSPPELALFSSGVDFSAQIIARDSLPTVLTDKFVVRYQLATPYAGGANSGAASGQLEPDEDGLSFTVANIALTPYADAGPGAFQPYPVAGVEAASADGQVARTEVVLAVSTETGCRNCHGGPWKDGVAGGVSSGTALDILNLHDKKNATELARFAGQGQTARCASCHNGNDKLPNLSAAVHGYHATMELGGDEACGLCHPASANGPTKFYRGYHSRLGLGCTRCHGALADHAISLLRHEAERGSPAAAKRLPQIKAVAVADASAIVPRKPGLNLPTCAGCHDFKARPDVTTATAFNKWTKNEEERFSRAYDNTGVLRCPSCHGVAHALYPAANPNGDERDNIQPLQYQGAAMPLGKNGNCAVCHTHDMDAFIHHDKITD